MVNTNKRTGDPEVYAVAKRYFNEGWATDGSVISPGRPVWTAAAFDELYRDFVEQADMGSGSFDSKLQMQLARSSDEAKQLMAELLALHLLVSRMITGTKKASLVNKILNWMRNPPALPADLLEAFEHGFINPGTYFNTGRPVHIQYLIRIGRRWKSMPAAERRGALDDPWRFKEYLGDLHGTGAGAQRHALLHLLFPETFEAIVSDDHIAKIVKSFTYALSGTTTDADRQLQEIRNALTPRYGEAFDFYDPRLRPLWGQGLDQWTELVKWAARLHQSPGFDTQERDYKFNAVERVPAAVKALGAGLDWLPELKVSIQNSNNNLTDWRVNAVFLDWAAEHEEAAAAALSALWAPGDEPVDRLQAFADAVQKVISTPGNRTALGSYLLMGTAPSGLPIYKPNPFKRVMAFVGRTASSGTERERYIEALGFCDELIAESAARGLILRDRLDAQSVIWVLAKSKADSPILRSWSEEDRRAFLAWRDGAAGTALDDDDGSQAELASVVTAETVIDWMQWAARETHLPVDYLAQLIRLLDDKGQIVLYGPPGTGKTFVAQALAEAICERDSSRTGLVQFHPSTTYEDFFEGIRPRTDAEGRIHYEVRPGPLARYAELAHARPDKKFVLVIDELNRANLPKVLGELLFLLEYRNREALTLYRADTPFSLPRNLWFIATMNTVDRSVAVIDSAMRRRFHFVPFYPDRAPVADVLAAMCADNEAWIAELVAAVNAELVDDLGGRDHQLGASHFIRCDRTIGGLEQVWTFTIEPLIEDQFYGQEDRVERYRWANVAKRHSGLIPGAVPDSGDPEPEQIET
jgi:5-methylcytosine-specific restriction protein B